METPETTEKPVESESVSSLPVGCFYRVEGFTDPDRSLSLGACPCYLRHRWTDLDALFFSSGRSISAKSRFRRPARELDVTIAGRSRVRKQCRRRFYLPEEAGLEVGMEKTVEQQHHVRGHSSGIWRSRCQGPAIQNWPSDKNRSVGPSDLLELATLAALNRYTTNVDSCT